MVSQTKCKSSYFGTKKIQIENFKKTLNNFTLSYTLSSTTTGPAIADKSEGGLGWDGAEGEGGG